MVAEISEGLIADGFLSVEGNRNRLEISNGVLDLESDYDTLAGIVGGSLSGVIPLGGAELQPELSFVYGKSFIGEVDFIGYAYGLSDDTLSLDAGNVTLANVTFRPELRVPLGDGSDSLSLLSIAPHLFCQKVDETEECNYGGEVGLNQSSADGLSMFNAVYSMDQFDGNIQQGVTLAFEQRF